MGMVQYILLICYGIIWYFDFKYCNYLDQYSHDEEGYTFGLEYE